MSEGGKTYAFASAEVLDDDDEEEENSGAQALASLSNAMAPPPPLSAPPPGGTSTNTTAIEEAMRANERPLPNPLLPGACQFTHFTSTNVQILTLLRSLQTSCVYV